MPELVIAAAPYVLTALASTAVSLVIADIGRSIASKKQKRAGSVSSAGSDIAPSPATVDPLSSVPDPGGPLTGVMGHRRIGGVPRLSAKSGNSTYVVYHLAGAAVHRVNGIYFNNVLISRDGGGQVTTAPWSDGTNYSAVVLIYSGTQIVADATLIGAFPGGWTADHIGREQVYAICIFNPSVNSTVFDPVYQQGIPDVTFDVCGFEVYDPRDGAQSASNPATWTYSDNVVLCRATYMIHKLGANLPHTLVDWPSVSAAATIADETVALKNGGTERRYTCSAHWTTDQRHEDVLARFDAADDGGMVLIGDKWRAYTGAFTTSSSSITPANYLENGLTFSDTPPLSELVNGVRGTFTSPLHNYETRDFPAYQDATALAADGVERWLDLDFSFVTSASQAQRLARIAYNKARLGYDASVHVDFTQFDVVAGDVVTITDDLAGMSAVTFRVVRDRIVDSFGLDLQLEYEASTFYSWTASTDEVVFEATAPLLGDGRGLVAPGGAHIDADASGTAFGGEIAIWAGPTAGADQYRAELQTTSGGAWGPTGDGQTIWTGNLASTQTAFSIASQPLAASIYGARIRIENSLNGAIGPWTGINLWNAVSTTTANGWTAATSTLFKLPAAHAPRIVSAYAGQARLLLTAANGNKADSIELWTNTTDNVGTATLLTTVANANTNYDVTGTVGQAKFYWARVKSSTGPAYGPYSAPVLLVF